MTNKEFEIEELKAQLRTQKLEVENLKNELLASKIELARSQGIISWMETSKFWKTRLQFLNIKRKLQQLLQKKIKPQTSNNEIVIFNSENSENIISNLGIPQFIPENPKILLVVEESIPQCLRYRVQQKLEQLQTLEYEFNWISWNDSQKVRNIIHFYHIVIFYRVPAFEQVIEIIKYAKFLNKVIFFDIDDLIFDAQSYPESFDKFSGQITREEYESLVKDTTLYRQALSLCDYAIASTPQLASEMAQVTGVNASFCHRNALDSKIIKFLQEIPPKLNRDFISIFYGSGTKTHDADFQVAAPAIAGIMAKYSNVRLTIIGYLTLPESLKPYLERIDRVGLLDNLDAYWEFIAQTDINIAPLTKSIFNDCKSEIKWLEAGVLGVASVVSATQMYLEILQDGVNVLIANNSEEWFEKLELLVNNPEMRLQIAKNAKQKALEEYIPDKMANNLKNIIFEGVNKSTSVGSVILKQPKKKLLFVNVLYPPQTVGGATVLLKNIVDTLLVKSGKKYEISIFTYDIENLNGYEISEYNDNGVRVTKISLPHSNDFDWRYQDQRVYEIFRQYLSFHQPDIIHFHCIQRLTASTVEAAVDLNISYIVTVHDAWWICDQQFMLDDKGVERDYRQSDPLIANRYANNINLSIQRRRYLRKLLNKANKVLAVSEFQAQIYRLNGLTQIQVNRNGIVPRPVLPRKLNADKKVRLGYAGGICIHKGYYFLKEAIISAGLKNSQVIAIDVFMAPDTQRKEKWGNTEVTLIPKQAAETMPDFFSNIDVLIAPSLWPESFGLITREATLAGVWVVASNKGGLAEDIRPGIDGDVFDPGDIQELVTILMRIDSHPQKYQEQLNPEDNKIRSIYEQVSELESIYESIISE